MAFFFLFCFIVRYHQQLSICIAVPCNCYNCRSCQRHVQGVHVLLYVHAGRAPDINNTRFNPSEHWSTAPLSLHLHYNICFWVRARTYQTRANNSLSWVNYNWKKSSLPCQFNSFKATYIVSAIVETQLFHYLSITFMWNKTEKETCKGIR